ncbi:MAG: trypsin-like peptidase domain-containing protein [Pirellulales bacterium]|nr:trypsin-like peptidase domain-containing protein [Pirellulales bacterium]
MTHSPRARRRPLCAPAALSVSALIGCFAWSTLAAIASAESHEISQRRLSPVVVAVKNARPSVVSLRGQKTVLEAADPTDSSAASEVPRQVNGMGTGAIIDERGYILTNYHVVADVRRIEVTLDDGRGYIGELVSHDSSTDLAVVKIPAPKPLPTIRLGTSGDLMEGESVIALGNAFGYEQTVTLGIISALGRDVQVSDTQSYDDLIQTDASINPGNSGGPLLNIDGEMIGVNVAVRAGAQGIGFAIPIDSALDVASHLLNVQRLRGRSHGLITRAVGTPDGPLQVAKVESASPAERIGIQPGDRILRIGSRAVSSPLDLERAFLDEAVGQPVAVELERGGQTMRLELALAESPVPTQTLAARKPADSRTAGSANARAWDVLGLELSEEPHATFARRSSRYRGGMRVENVRPNSPAAQEGILPGDILVGMHKWETASEQDIQYIVTRPNLDQLGQMKFYVLRGQETLVGQLNVATRPSGSASRR